MDQNDKMVLETTDQSVARRLANGDIRAWSARSTQLGMDRYQIVVYSASGRPIFTKIARDFKGKEVENER